MSIRVRTSPATATGRRASIWIDVPIRLLQHSPIAWPSQLDEMTEPGRALAPALDALPGVDNLMLSRHAISVTVAGAFDPAQVQADVLATIIRVTGLEVDG